MIRGGQTPAAHRAGLDRAVAAGVIAVALGGDRDDATLAAGLNGSEPGPVPGFICRLSAEATFAAPGPPRPASGPAGIACVQISAPAVRDSASRVVVVPGWRFRLLPTGLYRGSLNSSIGRAAGLARGCRSRSGGVRTGAATAAAATSACFALSSASQRVSVCHSGIPAQQQKNKTISGMHSQNQLIAFPSSAAMAATPQTSMPARPSPTTDNGGSLRGCIKT